MGRATTEEIAQYIKHCIAQSGYLLLFLFTGASGYVQIVIAFPPFFGSIIMNFILILYIEKDMNLIVVRAVLAEYRELLSNKRGISRLVM